MRRIAYIPARGGSKGIPKKNIVELHGRPLIAYSIEAAKASGLFDMIFVSTDSPEIAEVAKSLGADVPFLRDPAFAQDTTTTIATIMSDKRKFKEREEIFNTFCLLQPTLPLRTADSILGAVTEFETLSPSTGNGVVSISPVHEHPILMRTITENGVLKRLLSCSSTVRRQDMAPYYRVNGSIYVTSWGTLHDGLSLNDLSHGYITTDTEAVNIASYDDLHLAEAILSQKNQK